MVIHSSPLGAQLAGLRAAAGAQENRGWLPDALHALIMACLARLFGRLEQVFLLWQSGNLPLPASSQTPQGAAHGARTRHPRAPNILGRRRNPRIRAELNRVRPHGAATIPATQARPCAITPSAPRRVRSAHDPPQAGHPDRRAPLKQRRTSAAILLRFNN